MPQQSPSLPATQSQSTTQIPTTSISAPIDLILSAMKDHSSNANIQHYGCGALQKLAGNDNNKVVIADEGGIARIVSAMRTHPNNANVQEYGCAALRCLAENNEKNRVMIVKAGGKVTIACALQHNKSNVCVCCDRFICGTDELHWIKKTTLLQQKSRLILPNLKNQLQSCYTVLDPELQGLLLSPRARFTRNGEYLCCS